MPTMVSTDCNIGSIFHIRPCRILIAITFASPPDLANLTIPAHLLIFNSLFANSYSSKQLSDVMFPSFNAFNTFLSTNLFEYPNVFVPTAKNHINVFSIFLIPYKTFSDFIICRPKFRQEHIWSFLKKAYSHLE